jgi:predicted dehydrogenase
MNSALTRIARRRFLKSAAALAAASAVPRWFLEEGEAAPARGRVLGPNDQPAIALVGCGGMGRVDCRNASRFGRVVALCDVDQAHLDAAKAEWPKAEGFGDFRKLMERDDIDVVVCGTVDHWHVLVSMAAMHAGKDVYCEKPLSLTIDEGKHLVKAARKTGRIFQTGSQQRSERIFRLACELVRNGRIGTLKHVDVWLPAGLRDGPFHTSSVPAGFDYDFWLGSTPKVDYVKERTHFSFRYWWDYAGGTMTDWGAHHNDIALWGIGAERSGPVEIDGAPRVQMIPGGYTAVSEFEVHYTYANGVTHTCQSATGCGPDGSVVDPKGQQHGIRFSGSDGWIFVTRGHIEASNDELISTPLAAGGVRLYSSGDHMGNFFDCVRSRMPAICEPEIGHRSASVCHLGVIAMRLGRKLKWNPEKERFIGDQQADGWLARGMRKPWDYTCAGA